MANTLLTYDPIWYANRAIELLLASLNFPRYMYRAYEAEPRERGSKIQIRKPGRFTAQQMPISTEEDIAPEMVDIQLDQWWGTLVAVSDKELTYTGERYVQEHVAPMMHALATKIELSCVGLYKHIPWVISADAATPNKDWTGARKLLSDNNVPLQQRAFLYDTTLEERYLNTPLFNQANTAGDGGVAQRTGIQQQKFGFTPQVYFSPPTHTKGTLGGTPLVNGVHAKLDTTLKIKGATATTGNLKAGDSLKIAGNPQAYAVVSDATADASGNVTVQIRPGLRTALVGNEAITPTQIGGQVSIAMHEQAFALVMAPLSDAGNGRGAEIAYATDPNSGLSLRFRRFYEGKTAKNYIGFDALWGVQTLDENRAVRVQY